MVASFMDIFKALGHPWMSQPGHCILRKFWISCEKSSHFFALLTVSLMKSPSIDKTVGSIAIILRFKTHTDFFGLFLDITLCCPQVCFSFVNSSCILFYLLFFIFNGLVIERILCMMRRGATLLANRTTTCIGQPFHTRTSSYKIMVTWIVTCFFTYLTVNSPFSFYKQYLHGSFVFILNVC